MNKLIPLAAIASAALFHRAVDGLEALLPTDVDGDGTSGRRAPMWGEDNAWMTRLGDDMDRREKSERRDRHADEADMLARGWKRVPVPKAEAEAQYADAMEDWSLSRAEAGPMSGMFASMDYPQPRRSEFLFKWVPPKGRGKG